MAGGYNPWHETPSSQPKPKDHDIKKCEDKIKKCEDKIKKCEDKIKKWTERLNAIKKPMPPHDHRTTTAGDYF